MVRYCAETVQGMTLLPLPAQLPRIPIWVVGAWPRVKSMQRALRWDGIIPAKMSADGLRATMTPADIQTMKTWIAEQCPQATPFDIIIEGSTPGDDYAQAAAEVLPYAEAGATWWIEAMWSEPNGPEDVRIRIRQGPPHINE
jgi:hypothetical protein